VGERDARTGEYVVTSGLAAGDQVIRHPSALLKDGQPIQAAAPAKSSAVAVTAGGK
jgi:membrane fusion protein, multidrug efflux system